MFATLLLITGTSATSEPIEVPHPFSISRLEFDSEEDGLKLAWWIQSRTIMEEPDVAFVGEDLWNMTLAEAADAWPRLRPYLEGGFTLRVDGESWQPRFEEFMLEEQGATLYVEAFLPTEQRPQSLEVRVDHFFDGGNPDHTVDMEVRGFATETERWFLLWSKREAQFPILRDPNAPSPPSTFSQYFTKGRDHVLGGMDHVAFLAALLFGVAGLRTLLAAVTAFTVSHSITLALGALDILRLPLAWVEPGIALSISVALWLHLARSPVNARAWRVAFLFGLLHGSSFATQLRNLAEGEVTEKLLAFNLGVEVGQLFFVVPIVLAARAAARLLGPERMDIGRHSAALLLGGLALVLFGQALDSYTFLRTELLPESLRPILGALALAATLAAWARHRHDPQGRPLSPQVGSSLSLAALYLAGTWLGS
ncbi:MAG: HupE/UreJ family protein [Planctomycetes bacterium]|nr:HupE/UreJ family protein [Planctomycetota bacterium]